MTNIMLAVLRENQYKRSSKSVSIQHIFNRMIIKNEEIEGNYADKNQKKSAIRDLGSDSNPSFLGMCFSVLQLCMGQSNTESSPNYFDMI